MTLLDAAIARACYLATWSGAARFKRARAYFVADLVVLELMRADYSSAGGCGLYTCMISAPSSGPRQ